MKKNDCGISNVIRVPDELPPAFNGVFDVNIQGDNNKIIFSQGITGNKLIINIKGSFNKILIGKNCRLSGVLSIQGDRGTIDISKYTTIGGARIECEYGTTIFLGEDCMLSRDIVIRSGDSHSIIDMKTKKRVNNPESVYIGKHVWMGYGVNIGKGAVVQKNTVIGMSSYVNKKFSIGNVVLAGIPAKVVKKNVIWDRRSLPEDVKEEHIQALIKNYKFDENDVS